MPKRLR